MSLGADNRKADTLQRCSNVGPPKHFTEDLSWLLSCEVRRLLLCVNRLSVSRMLGLIA